MVNIFLVWYIYASFSCLYARPQTHQTDRVARLSVMIELFLDQLNKFCYSKKRRNLQACFSTSTPEQLEFPVKSKKMR